ncbi:MAG: hypothetical protein HYU37_11460 [Acidobacteria bacterium]|nr:hypothetical protein [Acidobacteriota bacterium]
MIGRLAVRSLTTHPVRSAVLAAGFGLGVAVMAILLGVAQIVLEQSRAPALVGGGDVLITVAPPLPGRLLLSGTLQSDALRPRIRAAAPAHSATLLLVRNGRRTPVTAFGSIPSLQQAVGDTETAGLAAWRDSADDRAWTQESPGRVLRYIDRFHPIPDAPAWADSWAEWLYFNGRGTDARFYLTFLVGPTLEDGRRAAGVRLQLDRGGRMEAFSASQPISEEEALRAPDLVIGRNSVRLDGMRYRVHLDLRGEKGRRVRGDLTLHASPGRLLPPLEIDGAGGWRTGYVVPVMSGTLEGTLDVDSERLSFDDGAGYHDHNWGFWRGVSWQWGQAQSGDVSLLYGRIFPPREAADPERLPPFVGVLGPDGPIAFTNPAGPNRGATRVTISESNDARGRPQAISLTAKGGDLDLQVSFTVESTVTTPAAGSGPRASGLDFLQMRGTYTVTGRAGQRRLHFSAPGSAETFRGQAPSAPQSARGAAGG